MPYSSFRIFVLSLASEVLIVPSTAQTELQVLELLPKVPVPSVTRTKLSLMDNVLIPASCIYSAESIPINELNVF
jgi:hypothetical protein